MVDLIYIIKIGQTLDAGTQFPLSHVNSSLEQGLGLVGAGVGGGVGVTVGNGVGFGVALVGAGVGAFVSLFDCSLSTANQIR